MLLAKTWAFGYALVILGVILGAVVLARPSRRKPEKKEIPDI